MPISVGTPGSTEVAGNPGTLAYNNAGIVLIGFVAGRNSAGATPAPGTTGTYNTVSMTRRSYAQRTWIATAIWELENPATGSNTYDPDGTSCTYSAWGAVGLIGARAVGALKDSDSATGSGTSATLSGAIETSIGGIIVAGCGRGHGNGIAIGDPAGWTNLFYETEAAGGALRASYKLTDGTPINPAFSLETSVEWALSVASYQPPLAGNQAIWMMSKIHKFYDEFKKGLIPSWDLQRRYKEVFI